MCQHPDNPQPRIYVASLTDYNNGRLHGVWLDADDDLEDQQVAIEAMLAASPTDPHAEEVAIHDHEGFGPLRVDENDRLAHIARIGAGIAAHGLAYAHFAALLGPSGWDDLDTFEDRYQGRWDSMTAYAEELLDSLGIDTEATVCEMLAPYMRFDTEAFARDLANDLDVSEDNDGIYVFEP
jgi:antirestriction protein